MQKYGCKDVCSFTCCHPLLNFHYSHLRSRKAKPSSTSHFLSSCLLSGTLVNAKTGNRVRFDGHFELTVRGFRLQTSFLPIFNSNAQICHNKIQHLLTVNPVSLVHVPDSNNNSVINWFPVVS
jgi:hypothetical protein